MSETAERPEQVKQSNGVGQPDYRSLLKDSFLELKRLQARIDALEGAEQARTEPIAIVGMGCRFPGGVTDPESFWTLLRDGVDAVTEVPTERWDIKRLYDPDPEAPGKISCRYGGFLRGTEEFDALFFGLAPREAVSLDPQQRLLLEVSWEALEDAGQAPDRLSGSRTGVFVGITASEYMQVLVGERGLEEIDAYTVVGNTLNTAAGRISYTLGLQGPSMAVDTACSSSLVAVHLAAQSLRAGESDLALAAGVNLILSPVGSIALSRARMLAPDGRCKTFDAAADGYVRGEGCGVLVLKRLSDALAAGDRIHAVVRGSAVNQDGPSSGLTVPYGPAQEAVLRAALAAGNVEPASVAYVEAHGTGTSLGDPIEARALGRVFGEGRPTESPLLIGSVKTNFGHLESAAGVAGIIKTVLALQHRELPPHLHFRTPSPHIAWDSLPVRVTADRTLLPNGDRPLFAGVSSFGASGTNAHVLLASAPTAESVEAVELQEWVLPLSARDENALGELAARYEQFLEEHPDMRLADVARTLALGRAHFGVRAAVVASSLEEAREQLVGLTPRPPSLQGKGETTVAVPRTASGSLPSPRKRGAGGEAPSNPLARRYLSGETIDWAAEGYTGQIVRLPTYPFQRRRCWIDRQPSLPAAHQSSPAARTGHPFLGTRLRLPGSTETRFETRFSTDSPPFLDDHRIYGTVIAPGASHVSMLLSTARQALGAEACVLEEVFFPQALILPDGEARVVQVVLEPGEERASRFRLLSAPEEETEAEWNLHATGSLSALATAPETEPFMPEAVRARCSEESSGAVFYPGFREVGYTLGPAFQWIGPIWRREGEALCQMEPPPLRESTDPYELYPGLVDSCFQLLCSCRRFTAEEITQGDSLFIPFSIGAFRYYGKPTGRLWCHARLPEQNDETLNGELRLYDEAGRLVAEVTGFTARRIQREAIQRATEARFPDWLYEIAWRPRPLPTGGGRIEGTWLLLADQGGIAKGLATSLRAAGVQTILAYPGEGYSQDADGTIHLDPTAPGGFRQLVDEAFGNGTRGGIVDLWALDAPQPEAGGDALLQARDRGPVSALHLLQGLVALGERRSGTPLPRLWLVTRGAQSESGGEVRPEQTAVWGLGRVLGMEHPELWGGLVDLDADTSATDLLAHLAAADGENQVLLHGGQRLAARLARGKLPHSEAVSLPADATYLLTGGLGGLGVLVAQWLVERGARSLALMERSGRSASHPALAEMEAAGARVVVLRGDVTREEDVKRVLAEIAETLPPLRGVIHAAGILDDGVLLRQDRARVHTAMAPKDEGAWHLHTHTRELPLDFFVLFSSASSFIGSPGQGNYAAGNAFLDGLAHHRGAAGLPALGINWGGWAEVGMAADRDLEARLTTQGLGTIPPDSGLRFLEALLGSSLRGEGPAQAAVLPFHWPRLVREVPPGMEPPLLVEILREVRPHAAAPTPSSRDHEELVARLQEAPLPERRDLLLAQIRDRATAVLGLDASQAPDPRQPLNELGLDSLMAIELRNSLGAAAGRTLPAMLLFDHPTLDALTDFLAREAFAEVLSPPPATNGKADGHWDEVATQLEALPDDDVAALMLAKLAALEEGDEE